MKTLRALKFLVIGPMIVALLFVINWMTSPGDWWVQWPALGILVVLQPPADKAPTASGENGFVALGVHSDAPLDEGSPRG